MRLAFFAALAMLPTAALAQAGSQTTLQAALTKPVAFVSSAARTPASAAAPSAPAAGVALSPVRGIHDLIETSVSADLRNAASADSGTIAYTFDNGSSASEFVTSPKLVHVVNRSLPESKAVPGKADVTVSMMVDPQGVPHAFRILRSAGSAVDKDTLEAISQYRFQPATVNNKPVEVGVTVTVELQK